MPPRKSRVIHGFRSLPVLATHPSPGPLQHHKTPRAPFLFRRILPSRQHVQMKIEGSVCSQILLRFPKGPFCLLTNSALVSGGVCVPGTLLDCFTGREAYFNLQKSERNMKELRESYTGGTCGLQVSEKDLTVALGR